ncbi:MAG: aminotransferase class I/II-fold pyridoxal phosphate-dependent enzyme [Myxococcota bacterium]
MTHKPGFFTRVLHHHPPEPEVQSRPVAPPIVQTASFAFDDLAELDQVIGGQKSGFGYSRASNPTVAELESVVAMMEGAEQCVAFASGMAAIHGVLMATLRPGDEILAPKAFYGGTYGLLSRLVHDLGIGVCYLDATSPEAFDRAITPKTRLIWAETITNPTLEVMDIPALAEIAKRRGIQVAVDATFTTPYLSHPIDFGADYVVHSATKYIGGHGDVIAGLVSGSAAVMADVRRVSIQAGGCLAPFAAWLLLRGVKTLGLRMDRHVRSALAVAAALEGHPKVERVRYPGLASHEAYGTLLLPRGSGGVVGFVPKGGLTRATEVVNKLELFLRAGSLGDAHSLVALPSMTSHRPIPAGARREAGIPDDYVRLSIGLEDPEDLIWDLDRAL